MKSSDFWKQKNTRILLAVSLLFVLACVVQMLRPNRKYTFEGEALFQEGVSAENVPVYGGIALPPGVYRVELSYSCDTNMLNLCRVQDSTVFPGGLLTGGEHFYSGLTATSFNFWLFERADALQIVADYGGEGLLRTGNLRICETNQLWGMCITAILFFTVLILLGRWLWWYNREYSIPRRDRNVIFALAVLVLVSSAPYLLGTVPSGADLGYHLLRIEGLKDGILMGQFPVRIEPRWLYGHGYANGIFYCGTLLLFPALLRMIGFPIAFSYSCYCIAINIATVGISYYVFSRIFGDKYIGVAGSALYTMSVFRICKQVLTAAVGEAGAFTFLPLIVYGFWRVFTEEGQAGYSVRAGKRDGLWRVFTEEGQAGHSVRAGKRDGFRRVFAEEGQAGHSVCAGKRDGFRPVFAEERCSRKYRTGWIPLALGYAGLLQTHVLTCEITVFLTVIVCLIFLKKVFRKETFLELVKGAAGALLLSLWFLVPFLDYYLREDLHIHHVWARQIQNRGLYPAQLLFHWWKYGGNATLGEAGMQNSQAYGVGLILALGFFLFGILWFSGRLRESDRPLWKLGRLAWGLGGLLMLLSLEAFPWDRIQNSSRMAASLVSSLQFPNRFLGWGTVFLVLVFCCCLSFIGEKGFGENGSGEEGRRRVLIAGLLCAGVSIATSGMYLQDYIGRDMLQLRLYNEESMAFGYISGAEYLVEGTDMEGRFFEAPAVSDEVRISDYEKGALRAEFQCVNTGNSEGYIDLPLLHYYGYQARAEAGQEPEVCKGENNLVRVIVPPGCDTRISVRFVSPWYWRAAEAVSYVTAVGMLMFTWRRRRMFSRAFCKDNIKPSK